MLRIASPERTRAWLGLFVAAQFADLLSTMVSLQFGGREANPLVSGIIAGGGLVQFTLLKLLGVGTVVILIIGADQLRRRLPPQAADRTALVLTRVLQVCVCVQLLAAAQNVLVLGTVLAAGPRFT